MNEAHPGKTGQDSDRDPKEELLYATEKLRFMVAHKVRKPIASASGLLILLRSRNTSPEEQDRMLGYFFETIDEIDASTQEMMRVINELEDRVLKNKNGYRDPGG